LLVLSASANKHQKIELQLLTCLKYEAAEKGECSFTRKKEIVEKLAGATVD
jgi:hypothetical protein